METSMSRKIAIIIVNYKTALLTIDCLDSIFSSDTKDLDFSIYVVDNKSGDESLARIGSALEENNWTDKVHLIEAERNGGFSYGNNLAIRAVLDDPDPVDYFWLLNSDTSVYESSLKELISFIEKHKNYGIVGSRLEDPDGTVQMSAFRDHTIMSELLGGFRLAFLYRLFERWNIVPRTASPDPHKTAWVAGASMLVRRELIDAIGLFDERFFLYYEEVDLCKRAHKAGYQCWYVPDSRVIHYVGASTGISDLRKKAPRRPTYWFESRRWFYLKHHGLLYLLLADLLWMTAFLNWRLRRWLLKREDLDPPYFLKDFFRNSVISRGKNF